MARNQFGSVEKNLPIKLTICLIENQVSNAYRQWLMRVFCFQVPIQWCRPCQFIRKNIQLFLRNTGMCISKSTMPNSIATQKRSFWANYFWRHSIPSLARKRGQRLGSEVLRSAGSSKHNLWRRNLFILNKHIFQLKTEDKDKISILIRFKCWSGEFCWKIRSFLDCSNL